MPGFASFGRPSKRLALAVGMVFVLVVAWIVAGWYATETTRKNIVQDVSQQLRSGAAQVDMARAAKFTWDEMFVFSPYYPKDEICKKLKITPFQCTAWGVSDVDEGEFFLVFMQQGAISQTVKLPRTIANFDESEKCVAQPIRKSAAVFTVERKPEVYLVCQ